VERESLREVGLLKASNRQNRILKMKCGATASAWKHKMFLEMNIHGVFLIAESIQRGIIHFSEH
jgi:hypothetical protein